MSYKEKRIGRKAVKEKKEKRGRHVKETCSYVSSFHRDLVSIWHKVRNSRNLQRSQQRHQYASVSLWYVT